jgi:hypothetical protein
MIYLSCLQISLKILAVTLVMQSSTLFTDPVVNSDLRGPSIKCGTEIFLIALHPEKLCHFKKVFRKVLTMFSQIFVKVKRVFIKIRMFLEMLEIFKNAFLLIKSIGFCFLRNFMRFAEKLCL